MCPRSVSNTNTSRRRTQGHINAGRLRRHSDRMPMHLNRGGYRVHAAVVGYVVAVTAVALIGGRFVPLLGSAVIALLFGTTLCSLSLVPGRVPLMTTRLGTRTLQLSIVVLGFSVNLMHVLTVARASLPVMLGTLAIGLAGIWLIGGVLKVRRRIRALVTVGTSVCGASAIAAVAPILGVDALEIGYAVSIIFLFNITAVIAFPPLAHMLGFSATTFAVWAGTAINDTSSVLAAGFAFGSGAAATAAVVKLARTVMILPISIGMAMLLRRHQAYQRTRFGSALRRGLPWFIVAFLVATIINALGIVPPPVASTAAQGAQLGTVVALAAIGLGTNVRTVKRAGPRPLLLGLMGWILLASASLGLQGLTHAL